MLSYTSSSCHSLSLQANTHTVVAKESLDYMPSVSYKDHKDHSSGYSGARATPNGQRKNWLANAKEWTGRLRPAIPPTVQDKWRAVSCCGYLLPLTLEPANRHSVCQIVATVKELIMVFFHSYRHRWSKEPGDGQAPNTGNSRTAGNHVRVDAQTSTVLVRLVTTMLSVITISSLRPQVTRP